MDFTLLIIRYLLGCNELITYLPVLSVRARPHKQVTTVSSSNNKVRGKEAQMDFTLLIIRYLLGYL